MALFISLEEIEVSKSFLVTLIMENFLRYRLCINIDLDEFASYNGYKVMLVTM